MMSYSRIKRFVLFIPALLSGFFLGSCASDGNPANPDQQFYLNGEIIQLSLQARACIGPIADGSRNSQNREKENEFIMLRCAIELPKYSSKNIFDVLYVVKFYPVIGQCIKHSFSGRVKAGKLVDYRQMREQC